jgi:hypothetical protein
MIGPLLQLPVGPRGRGAAVGLRQEEELRRAGGHVQLQPRALQQDQQGAKLLFYRISESVSRIFGYDHELQRQRCKNLQTSRSVCMYFGFTFL